MLQRKFSSALLAGMLAAGLLSPSPAALAGGTLRVAMTASDVPMTTGAPDNGYEGMRFLGFPVYEGLCCGTCRSADKLADIRPGTCREMGAGQGRQDQMDLPPAPAASNSMTAATSMPTPRSGTSTAISKRMRRNSTRPAGPSPGPQSVCREIPQNRRLHDRDHQSAAAQLLPGHARLHALFEPCTVRQDRLMGRVRQGAVRHRAVQDHRVQAARQRHAEPQRGLLGQGHACRSSTR